MRRQVFQPGIKPLATDFTAIGLNRQDAFASLLSAFSLDPAGVLFDDQPPVATQVGDTITVLTPNQLVGVEGALASSATYSEDFDVTGGIELKVEVFFVMRETPATETRNFLSTNPTTGNTVFQNLSTEVAQDAVVDVVYLFTNDIASADQTPVLGADDLGFVKLGTVFYDGAALSVVEEVAPRFTIPAGASVPVVGHRDTHLPNGTDPIPLAALSTSVVAGSTPGLMPEGALKLIDGALQDVTPTSDSTFLTFATVNAGDDTNPLKVIRVGLEHDNSLQGAGSPVQLGVNFRPPSTLIGTDFRAARSDHKHALSESGLIVINKSREVTATDFGQIFSVVLSSTDVEQAPEQILSVSFHWSPLNLNASGGLGAARVECGWQIADIPGSGLTTLGARAAIINSTLFSVEVGASGMTQLSPAMEGLVQSWTSPSYTGGTFPREGTLHMTIVALREGAGG